MRATKDKFETADPADRKGLSGLTSFDGEDRCKDKSDPARSIRGQEKDAEDATEGLD